MLRFFKFIVKMIFAIMRFYGYYKLCKQKILSFFGSNKIHKTTGHRAENTVSDTTSSFKRKKTKVFADDEGSYVDFEEMKG